MNIFRAFSIFSLSSLSTLEDVLTAVFLCSTASIVSCSEDLDDRKQFLVSSSKQMKIKIVLPPKTMLLECNIIGPEYLESHNNILVPRNLWLNMYQSYLRITSTNSREICFYTNKEMEIVSYILFIYICLMIMKLLFIC
jgi:hypothetical protein